MAAGQLDYVLRHLRALIGRQNAQSAASHTDGVLLDRFLADHDEEAFATLLQRHGPLVLSVCRRVLGDGPDAEDAFQATFLVLVRRARSLDRTQPLGPWLYRVAQKIAVRAQSDAARRHTREKQGINMALLDHATEQSWNDLRPVLDEELAKLPEKYRAPLVLCDLQGKTHEQAALELGWPVGSMSRRLSRGRELLRKRLIKRGLTLSAGVLAAALTRATASAAVPTALAMTTTRAALMVAAGQAAGVASVHVLQLAEGVTHMVWVTKTKIAVAAAIVVMTVAAGGTGVWLHRTWKNEQLVAQAKDRTDKEKGTEPEKPKDKTPEPPPKDEPKPPENDEKKDPNDPFGDPLPFGAIARMGTLRLRVDTPFQALTFSNDDKMLAAISKGRNLRVWQMPSGKLLWEADLSKEHKNSPTKWPLLFSPDGKSLVTPVAIYDTESAKPIKVPLKGKGLIATAAFSPNGDEIALSWTEGGMSVLSTETMAECRTSKEKVPYYTGAQALSYSPDGKTLAALALEGAVGGLQVESLFLSDLSEKGIVKSAGYFTGPIRCLLFSADSKKIYAARGNDIEVLDPDPKARGKRVGLRGHNSSVVLLAPGPDKDSFVSVGEDGIVRIWSAGDDEKGSFCKIKDAMPPALAFAHDGKTVAFVAKPGAIQFGNFKTGEVKPTIEGHQNAISGLSFAPNGRTLATSSSDRAIKFWNPSTGIERFKPLRTDQSIKCAGWSADGKALATISDPGPPRLWDVASGKEMDTLRQQKGGVWALAFSPTRPIIAIARERQPIEVIDAELGETRFLTQKRTVGVDGGRCVTFSPDGKLIAAGSEPTDRFLQPREGLVAIWDAESGKLLREFGGQPSLSFHGIRAIAFTPDSKGLVYADDNQLVLCDVSTGRPYRRFEGHEKEILCLALSPDGRTLASAGQDGTLRLWEVLTGREIRRFDGHADKVYCLAFSPDGRRLASGSGDTTALVWDVYGAMDPRRPLRDPLIPELVDEYWADLAGPDVDQAFHAIASLTKAHRQSLRVLKQKLSDYHPPDAKKINQLFKDLLDELPPECDQAYQELLEVGGVPEDALRAALKNSPTDILRSRLDQLLEYHEIGRQGVPIGQRLQILRALAVLELIATDDAKSILQSLAKGNPKDPVVREAKAVLGRMK